jgi:hypothetical protein
LPPIGFRFGVLHEKTVLPLEGEYEKMGGGGDNTKRTGRRRDREKGMRSHKGRWGDKPLPLFQGIKLRSPVKAASSTGFISRK